MVSRPWNPLSGRKGGTMIITIMIAAVAVMSLTVTMTVRCKRR
jgi:hypothetical protein